LRSAATRWIQKRQEELNRNRLENGERPLPDLGLPEDLCRADAEDFIEVEKSDDEDEPPPEQSSSPWSGWSSDWQGTSDLSEISEFEWKEEEENQEEGEEKEEEEEEEDATEGTSDEGGLSAHDSTEDEDN
jgi:hypothetical protein